MAGPEDDSRAREKGDEAAARRARLEQELRANLLKRKAQARARTAKREPSEEGGQREG